MKKIMVIDDSKTVRDIIQDHLEERGFKIILFDDAKAASKMLLTKKELPNLIFCDLDMPEMNGFVLCRTLKRNDSTKSIPIIMITSHNEDWYKDHGEKCGCDAYITKPFTERNILDAVKKYMI